MPQLASQAYNDVQDNSNEDLINFYPEQAPEGARFPFVLIGTSGLKLWVVVGSGPIRGQIKMAGLLYVISGTELYKVTSAGVKTLLGTITGSAKVSLAHNKAQVVIVVPGIKAYIATSASVALITDPDYLTADTVAYIDGYFVFSRTGNTGQFFWSAINDGFDIDALDFATAESLPDPLVAVFADHQELQLFGTRSIDVYRNTGAPFARMSGAGSERGLGARFAIAKADNSIFWLGDDFTSYRMLNRVPTRISTHAMESAIRGYANPELAESFAYTERGHVFYVAKFTEATWVIDASNGRIHKRRSKDRDNWRVGNHHYAFKKNLVGDDVNGNIYELDPDTYSDNGDEIIRIADFPYVHAQQNEVFHNNLEVIFAPGVGLTSGQGSDPQAMMSYSDDGGRTFSNELWRSVGKIGEYLNRAHWNRLGSSERRTYRVTVSDPVDWKILGAKLGVSVGRS